MEDNVDDPQLQPLSPEPAPSSPYDKPEVDSIVDSKSPQEVSEVMDKTSFLSEPEVDDKVSGSTVEVSSSAASATTPTYSTLDDVIKPTSSSSFGESHVTRLQSFVDSVAVCEKSVTWPRRPLIDTAARVPTTFNNRTSSVTGSWHGNADHSKIAACTASTSGRLPGKSSRTGVDPDQPLDLSLKSFSTSRSRGQDHTHLSSSTSFGEFPFSVLPTPFASAASLFPLFACRDTWIAHWAALAAASLQQSALFPPPSMTSPSSADAQRTSGATTGSPRSSTSSSPSAFVAGSRVTDDRKSTALTAMESFVESSFISRSKTRPRRSPVANGPSSVSLNRLPPSERFSVLGHRKRRHHNTGDIPSSGDEDGTLRSDDEKRKRTDASYWLQRQVDVSCSPRSDESSSCDADRRSGGTKREVTNGDVEYISCSSSYTSSASEHPLRSLEKFVSFSPPLFRSSAELNSTGSNGLSVAVITPPRPRVDRSPLTADDRGAVAPDDHDVTMTSSALRRSDDRASTPGSATKTRPTRGSDDVISGSLTAARSFSGSGVTPSMLCCNL